MYSTDGRQFTAPLSDNQKKQEGKGGEGLVRQQRKWTIDGQIGKGIQVRDLTARVRRDLTISTSMAMTRSGQVMSKSGTFSHMFSTQD